MMSGLKRTLAFLSTQIPNKENEFSIWPSGRFCYRMWLSLCLLSLALGCSCNVWKIAFCSLRKDYSTISPIKLVLALHRHTAKISISLSGEWVGLPDSPCTNSLAPVWVFLEGIPQGMSKEKTVRNFWVLF